METLLTVFMYIFIGTMFGLVTYYRHLSRKLPDDWESLGWWPLIAPVGMFWLALWPLFVPIMMAFEIWLYLKKGRKIL
jgi:hypothetical protein